MVIKNYNWTANICDLLIWGLVYEALVVLGPQTAA